MPEPLTEWKIHQAGSGAFHKAHQAAGSDGNASQCQQFRLYAAEERSGFLALLRHFLGGVFGIFAAFSGRH
jgi:hypothetical protein